MISVALHGRLGNQLFQYAFAKAASSLLACRFYLDRERAPFYPEVYFSLSQAELKQWEKAVFRPLSASSGLTLWARRWFYPLARRVLTPRTLIVDDVAPDLDLLGKVTDRTFYEGYFQSEAFFAPVAAQLRAELVPREFYQKEFAVIRMRYRATGKKICAVHVRGGDYKDWNLPALGGGDMRLPKSYYDQALAGFSDSSWRVVPVGDDANRMKEVMPRHCGENLALNSEIIDLLTLADADAVVISNSSFAWWGAWMGERPERIVIAPKFFNGFKLGREIPHGILPQRWETLEV